MTQPFDAHRYDFDLAWLDRRLEREVYRLRARSALSMDELRGLYISDRHVDELLRRPSAQPPGSALAQLDAEAVEYRARRPSDTPLEQLACRLALSQLERDILLLALAPELALKYETLYAYLNDDVTRRHATVDLALRILDADDAAGRATLLPGARLFALGLLEWVGAASEGRALRARGFTLSPPASQFLLGLPVDDPRVVPELRVVPPGTHTDDDLLSPSARECVDAFTSAHPNDARLTVVTSEVVSEQLAAARRHASRLGRPLLAISVPPASADEAAWSLLGRTARLLAMLSGAAVVVADEAGSLPVEPTAQQLLRRLLRNLSAARVPVFWAAPRGAPWAALVNDQPFALLALPETTCEERTNAWSRALAREGLRAEPTLIDELAERFALPCSRIRSAARSAAMAAAADGTEEGPRAHLWAAARLHSNQALAHLTTRTERPHRWEHLVLPEATLARIQELASAVAQRDRVYRRWRMAERTGTRGGLTALFAGASGTGKTMTASVIAAALGVELYRIDLAAVVSKYIGETEKNLERIFGAARRANAILLFDEAEALLGKRSEVKDAHDRYANVEVAYLLQRMEEHDGVVILATNLARNLDQAFIRRIHYIIEFPRPDAALRERLWRGMFPPEAPLGDDVDFRFLAEQFDTAGGEIQTIALDAAFMAAADQGKIGMAHLVQAMARHRTKQGNPAGVSDFKHYHALARRA